MTQLGLEPRPPRPGIHCTNHYATATKAPLPPPLPPSPLPPTPPLTGAFPVDVWIVSFAFPLYTFYGEFEDKNFLKR